MPDLNPDTSATLSRSGKAGALGGFAGLLSGPTIMLVWNTTVPSKPITPEVAGQISAVATWVLGIAAAYLTKDHAPAAAPAVPAEPTAPVAQ